MRELRPKGKPPRKKSNAARADQQPQWLKNKTKTVRKNEGDCRDLEDQIAFMRLNGDPASTAEERERWRIEATERVKHRSTAYSYTATAASE